MKNVLTKVVDNNMIYTQIKDLPGVVDVFECNMVKRSKCGINPSGFIQIGDKIYFIKYPTAGGEVDLDGIFTELFTSFLAKKININCVDYKLAINRKAESAGVISPSFGEHFLYSEFGGKVSWSIFESTTVKDILDHLESRFRINRRKLCNQLNVMSLFDFLTCQVDRHEENIAFLVNKNNEEDQLDLAPLYDNLYSFYVQHKVYTYHIMPNDAENFGEAKELLCGQYVNMLNQFKILFSPQNFSGLMQEFNSLYGIDKLYKNIDNYYKVVQQIYNMVSLRIRSCTSHQSDSERE